MCGITGVLHYDGKPVSKSLLQEMTTAIAHRGPDGEGHYIDGCVGLGHRRLAIIDLTPAGIQPMISADQRYVLVFNGEVYNFRELRSELETCGYHFVSKTDSEVVLYAFAEWGSACVNRFNGMFALAIWDTAERRLFLARDRYGIKPLYYSLSPEYFLFGSEQKAMLAHPVLKREIDLEGLVEYFTFQNFFSQKTLLKNICVFPAGTWAEIALHEETPRLRLHTYWDFDFQHSSPSMSEQEYGEEFERLFRRAVQRQLVSDVEIGAYLSGGLDSGSITALMTQAIPSMKSFTVGFDLSSASGLEMGFDERARAEMMSNLFKTEHYEMVLKAGDMERSLPVVARHLEEPRVGQSYPNYYAAKLASRFVKVVLSGVGGDELFAGYPWRYCRVAGSASFDEFLDRYYSYWQRLIPENETKSVFAPVWEQVKHVDTRELFYSLFSKRNKDFKTPEDGINHSLFLEAKTFLHGLLIVEDKLSMAHGLETRIPFLDNDLVDFAQKIPVNLKLRDLNQTFIIDENEPGPKRQQYYAKTNDGKNILRQVMKKFVPESISLGVKQGFSAPDSSWFKGESIDFVRRKLFEGKPQIFGFLDQKHVLEIVREHLAGKKNHRLFIWSLLNVEEWCHQNSVERNS
jgi:asparagine synthase (glutamine-hydrolysing)